jgi:1-pyrroline-5-carboxylate dehydrogenase
LILTLSELIIEVNNTIHSMLQGNGVLWKPSDSSLLSNYTVFRIVREAGLPPGVVNFVPADGPIFGDSVTSSPHLGGINFTGSVA